MANAARPSLPANRSKKPWPCAPPRSRVAVQFARAEFLLPRHGGDVAAQFLEPVVADGDAEILPGHVLHFVRLVEDHGVILGQDAAVVVLPSRQVGEEQVVVDDDDVAFVAPAGASG